MEDLYQIEGNKYVDPRTDEQFIVKNVELWGNIIVALFEYEDGEPWDERASWVINNCELVEKNAAPADLTFYTDEGLMEKAYSMGMDFAEENESSTPHDFEDIAKFFKNTVRGNNITNQRNKTFSEELERFINSGANKQDVVDEAWDGFMDFVAEIAFNVQYPDDEQRQKQIEKLAVE